MSRPSAPHRRAGIGRWAGLGLAPLLLAATAVSAQQANSLYPPASLFRSLQLTTLACGRDNDTASCDKARSMANPLLDHPRLSATCKDTLWAILNKAVVAPTNSFERRDRIDRAGKDVTALCRPPITGTASGGNSSGGSGKPAGGSAGNSLFKPVSGP